MPTHLRPHTDAALRVFGKPPVSSLPGLLWPIIALLLHHEDFKNTPVASPVSGCIKL